MGYVATKGGTQAVLNAEKLVEFFRVKGESEPISVQQIQDQMRLAVDRAMSEGALYAPSLAALALKQSEGDAIEASFLLRAYRSTLPRLNYTLPSSGLKMRLLRRISSTFKDIPGGQLLGPTRDYQLKLLNTVLNNESNESIRRYLSEIESDLEEQAKTDHAPLLENELGQNGLYPKVVDSMRARGILAEASLQDKAEATNEPEDITRKAISFPAARSARLQMMARGDVGSLLTFAYSSVRGYGDAHPTLGELRVGYLPVEVKHPHTGEAVEIGEILVTECEMVSRVYDEGNATSDEGNPPKFGLGYGFCFGHSEVKAISMSILDRVMSAAKASKVHGQSGPAADEEFVLQHIDGIEASGFTAHFKLPHYVTFQADIKVMEQNRDFKAIKFAEASEKRQQIKQKHKPAPFKVAMDEDDDE